MSKTRNNTSNALAANENFTGPVEKTNGFVTIAVTALTARNATLTINQYLTEGAPATVTSTFTMVGGSTYLLGQPVVLPFFNVVLTDSDGANHAYTRVNTVLNPNNVNDHNLQFVNTQTMHMTIQGSRGNVHNQTLAEGGFSNTFNCSTYGNNSVMCYEDRDKDSQDAIIVQASSSETGNDWVVIGALPVFVPGGANDDKRYSFSAIRLGAFKRLRINNAGTQKPNSVCSVYSS